MAKKRKLRSSEPEPEPAKPLDPSQDQDLQQQQQQQPEELILDQQQQQQQQEMAVDDPAPPQEQPQNDVANAEDEEEEEDDEGEEQQQQQQEGETLENQGAQLPEQASGSDPVQAEANGAEQEEDLELEDEPIEKLLEPFTKEQLHSLVKQAIEKHPDFADNVRQLADVDPAHRKIFIHGLGWDTTAETLTAVFGRYGEIEDCKAVTDKLSGKSKGYAFILFKHRAGARRALKQPQKKIGNRTTSCQLASAGPVPAPPPHATAAAPVVSEYTQRKIFVSNVSAEIDPQKLLEFFKQFGEVEDGPLGLDKQTGKPKGFALFVYKTVESAKKALEEPHKNFEGHTLYCQKAVDGPKGNKGYHQHQHQHHQQQHYQHHSHHHHQSHYHRKDKNKYSSGGPAHGGGAGHLMAPSAAAAAPAVGGYNPGVPPAAAQGLNPALGQALTALLANQGAGLGLGNLLGGLGGAPVNQPGPPAGAYGNQPAMGYGNQPGMQPGYQNPQMGQSSGVRPHPGAGAPYMGH